MNQTLFLTIGYIVFALYTCGIMYLGTVLEKKSNIDKEICRKLTHIVSAFVWVIMQFFFGCTIHWVILNAVGTVALGIVTFGNLMDTYSRNDADKSYGLFYFGLSTCIVAMITYLIGEEVYLYAGVTYFCLALGDGFAPITAKLAGRHNVSIMPGRSLVGSLTVLIVSALAAAVFSWMFGMDLDITFILSVAALTCLCEFYGLKGCDNLLIEFAVYGYLLLYHFGMVNPVLQVVLIVTPFIAMPAIRFKALSVSGGIAAMVFILALAFFSGRVVDILFTVLIFAFVSVTSKISKKAKQRHACENHEKKGRNGWQIVGVGLWSLVAVILHYAFDNTIFAVLFFLALAEQFADSMASDIGSLTSKKNVDILTFKPVEKGISGGVSLLGTLCALAGAFVILLFPFLFGAITPVQYLILSIAAFVGAMIDSVLGSLLQALYECRRCGARIERHVHCNEAAALVKGFGVIDNVSVNILSGLLTCIIGGAILLI